MAKNNLEIIGFVGGSRITATICFRPSFKCKAPRSGAICTPKRGDWSGKNLQLLSTFLGQAVTSFVHFWTGSISCKKQQRIEGGALRIKIEQIEFGGWRCSWCRSRRKPKLIKLRKTFCVWFMGELSVYSRQKTQAVGQCRARDGLVTVPNELQLEIVGYHIIGLCSPNDTLTAHGCSNPLHQK